MQFFDLSRKFNLDNILTPRKTLTELQQQEWFLSKIRIEHDCLTDTQIISGQVVLCSNEKTEIELEWLIEDTGYSLNVLFKGIETVENETTMIMVKGALLVDQNDQCISIQALKLWIDGTLLPMLPGIRTEIKSRLNLWDYASSD
ncbi:hypothetical protein CDG60_09360 [Acinetobacter chinensis]|uniref:Uncharacterized protein n=1 Tax=Acinetobacter chinensis TaxID=2004650 RepID=A0A3B7LXQ5_9GAMM|nr:hypothetical protein [Acinetobacter chinensis]AXY56754.1 hypothetical protein CDG60_09360 [Acinetobacter chinensis]